MDGREAMSMSGPSYYMQRGMGAAGPGAQPGLRGPSPVIRSMPNPGASLAMQSSVSFGHGFHVESPPPPPPPPPPPTAHEVGAGAAAGEPVKRKRGRPRKYGPDGSVSLGLSPMSASAPQGVLMGSGSVSASAGPSQRRGRGRPPGTGRKQQLALLGEWVAGSAGMGFTPHVIRIEPGEDIASKIMSFSQQGPRAVCILSANGVVSAVTLRQPASTTGTVTFEGRFEILCLSGSYLPSNTGGTRGRTGGLSVSLSGADGRVLGGGVGGRLTAATPVQVIVGSFMYGGTKAKNKASSSQDPGAEPDSPIGATSSTPTITPPNQNLTPVMGGWSSSRHLEIRPGHIDIDLTRG
ncbi:AT-hook motif nuclear-localized protein 9 [Ananas comosus]|uniref:AT-hook motif nuclear-localized protein n=1 Tax=Ananas comosus TaxID=4615 RepID=A0A199VAK2_ANACO|nr:AT-hook motif nuclear-localized protein 9 [Ananas comosus]XP_020084864.1 AT-hook motif nuclear-localized protein 9 [Ananas comosus]OAY74114.1 AT-hook motif nuclear-localized protein 9 [Ananas comosus]